MNEWMNGWMTDIKPKPTNLSNWLKRLHTHFRHLIAPSLCHVPAFLEIQHLNRKSDCLPIDRQLERARCVNIKYVKKICVMFHMTSLLTGGYLRCLDFNVKSCW